MYEKIYRSKILFSSEVAKSEMKNDTASKEELTHDNSIHLSIYPNGKIALKTGHESERMALVNSTLQKFEPHDSGTAVEIFFTNPTQQSFGIV